MRWCAKWYEAFSDPVIGGYHERLGKGFKPVPTGQRRLVTQCRQLSIYSHAIARGNTRFKPDLKRDFDFIVAKYYNVETGLWAFSLDDDGNVLNTECDLYALSFVIFSFSHYYRATKDERAQTLARQTLLLISARFGVPGQPGLAEGLDVEFRILNQMRRQNPHMHLLEACLFAHETWGESIYERMADDIVALFQDYFFDSEKCLLREYFDTDLSPHPVKGGEVQPGHYFEWVWLLKKHAALKHDHTLHDAVSLRLFEWANDHGWDDYFGGIYDSLWEGDEVLENTKRIWPFCEALKANALMLPLARDRQAVKDRVSAMVDLFEDKYMQKRGFWIEWLNRDLSPATDYMPGTTPYHVYFGITETMDILQSRGEMKSLSGKLSGRAYALRRMLSRGMKTLRLSMAK